MGFKVGKTCTGVKYINVKVAGLGTWSLSGFTRETLEDTEFGDDVRTFLFGPADPGTIDFAGLHDPIDTSGQVLLNSLLVAGTIISSTGTAGLIFMVDTSSYWGIGSGGSILITKGLSISMDKSRLAQVSFSGKVSGAAMVFVP